MLHSCQCILGILNPAVFFLLQVCEWKEPEELAQLLDLELRATGEPHQKLLERVRDVAKYSIKTSKDVGSDQYHIFTQYLVHFISVQFSNTWEILCPCYLKFPRKYMEIHILSFNVFWFFLN